MKQSTRLNRLRYGLYAPVYDLVARPFRAGRRRALERLDVAPGERVLLVGCGTGADLEYLPAGAEVVAVDVTPAMVRRTRRRAGALDRDVGAMVGDAGALPLADDAFDAVALHLVLSVVPDPGAVVAETDRVVAPDGRVSVFDKFAPDEGSLSPVRRLANPVTSLLFSDVTRRLGPLFADTGLTLGERESVLGGLYTVTVARPA